VLETGVSEKNEPVYLLLGHVDSESQRKLKAKIFSKHSAADETRLNDWPLAAEPSL
jgi:acyl homoserine lactone synthase